MKGWNFANVLERIAEQLGDAPAQMQGNRRFEWAQFDRRADGVARVLLDAGVQHQDKVAQYLHNCPEYIESVLAAMKAGLVPVNTNYRYLDNELVYLWDNADVVAVVFHGVFASRVERLRKRLPRVRTWLWVDDGSGGCLDWAVAYEEASASARDRASAPWGRSGDDLLLLYTGGTTGLPRGVMWRQDDLYRVLSATTMHDPDEPDFDAIRTRLTGPGPVGLPACPLMHGTGLISSLRMLLLGGSIVTLTSRTLDVEELLDTIHRKRVHTVVIAGDAIAKPLLAALDANPDRWDISSLSFVKSSGVMWSEAVKRGLLRHSPGMVLQDSFGSTEAVGLGESLSTSGTVPYTGRFTLGESTRVIAENGRDVVPGSGEIGMVALRGHVPVGYYKDPEKTSHVFPVIEGERYSIPGDYATVEADGMVHLLGRGSLCINTGGEKVYPEEVEAAMKEHPAVHDVVVVGVPDDRFGEAVVALIEPARDRKVDGEDVIAHVKSRLAGYKTPRHVLTVDSLGRAPNGKIDYRRLREEAVERIGGVL